MAAREDLKMRLTRLRGQTARLGRTGLSGPAVLRTAEVGIHLMLAAVLAGTGGVSVNGMLRLLGSGTIDFFERNQRLAETGMTIVAEDVFGGIFGLGKDGTLLYLAPDELAVEEFGDDYAELLEFACSSEDMDRFYRDYVKECPGVLFDQLPADKGVSLYPPLWEPSDEKRSAAAVPMNQLQDVEIGVMKKQAGQEDENDGGAEE